MEFNNLRDQNLVREISYSLSRHSGWLKFVGIASMVYGALMAISILGLVIAWLPIWMGYLLVKAANKAKVATAYGDQYALEESLQHIGNYFIINGIIIIIAILAMLFLATAMLFFGLSFDTSAFEGILT